MWRLIKILLFVSRSFIDIEKNKIVLSIWKKHWEENFNAPTDVQFEKVETGLILEISNIQKKTFPKDGDKWYQTIPRSKIRNTTLEDQETFIDVIAADEELKGIFLGVYNIVAYLGK